VTAITLNLLAEEQLAEQAEARDPFKMALAVGIGLFALTILTGTMLAYFAEKKKTEASALQAKWDNLAAAQGAVAGSDFKSLKAQAEEIAAMNSSRQLFAQQMALIKDMVPESLQLNRIDLTMNVELQEAPAPTADTGGDETNAKRARVARPKNVEHLALVLTGRAINSRPELEVDQFIRTLRNYPTFAPLIKDAKLRSIARTGGVSLDVAASGPPMADFVIECQYKERK
jgi:hypothetical protein